MPYLKPVFCGVCALQTGHIAGVSSRENQDSQVCSHAIFETLQAMLQQKALARISLVPQALTDVESNNRGNESKDSTFPFNCLMPHSSGHL